MWQDKVTVAVKSQQLVIYAHVPNESNDGMCYAKLFWQCVKQIIHIPADMFMHTTSSSCSVPSYCADWFW